MRPRPDIFVHWRALALSKVRLRHALCRHCQAAIHFQTCARATAPSRVTASHVCTRHARQPAPLSRAELTTIAHHAFVRNSVSSTHGRLAAMQRGRIARSALWLRRYLRRDELFGAR